MNKMERARIIVLTLFLLISVIFCFYVEKERLERQIVINKDEMYLWVSKSSFNVKYVYIYFTPIELFEKRDVPNGIYLGSVGHYDTEYLYLTKEGFLVSSGEPLELFFGKKDLRKWSY
ncbi:hypothetical protein M0R19_05750 [Candidatus Pacearchaeota archaeon]|nr:hypothetical protein [Candidatus Pacearchaeota archaeon]